MSPSGLPSSLRRPSKVRSRLPRSFADRQTPLLFTRRFSLGQPNASLFTGPLKYTPLSSSSAASTSDQLGFWSIPLTSITFNGQQVQGSSAQAAVIDTCALIRRLSSRRRADPAAPEQRHQLDRPPFHCRLFHLRLRPRCSGVPSIERAVRLSVLVRQVLFFLPLFPHADCQT